ncbi:MAG: dTDP-glucose 4,6-dehydratase [Xanthobacteraceae bacterium]
MGDNIVLVTGGAGFIGSALVRHLIGHEGVRVVNVDALTYAANPANLAEVDRDPRYCLEHIDICSAAEMERIFRRHHPQAVLHLAAESHVDRSIDDPLLFVRTNVLGTATLLQAAHRYWRSLAPADKARFRFHHVSTDEVFGSLGASDLFSESSPYKPNSPYAASKAAADHLVRAWNRTYQLPVIISNCSNNYGPFQFPEKFIPLMIINALQGQPMPIYGRGENVRDWLFVDDHAQALALILKTGAVGECYNVGGGNEVRNVELAGLICDLVDEIAPPLQSGKRRRELLTFVADRPGHDERYAIDATKIRRDLGWAPAETFESGLRRTVAWYLAHEDWWAPLRAVATTRLGLAG